MWHTMLFIYKASMSLWRRLEWWIRKHHCKFIASTSAHVDTSVSECWKSLSVWVGIRTCQWGTRCVDSLAPRAPLQPQLWPLSVAPSASASSAFTFQIHLRLSHLSVTFSGIYSWLMRITHSLPVPPNSQPEKRNSPARSACRHLCCHLRFYVLSLALSLHLLTARSQWAIMTSANAVLCLMVASVLAFFIFFGTEIKKIKHTHLNPQRLRFKKKKRGKKILSHDGIKLKL